VARWFAVAVLELNTIDQLFFISQPVPAAGHHRHAYGSPADAD
jgi:hypothetical protein